MKQYHKMLESILQSPITNNRTGIPTFSKPFYKMEFDLARDSFPAITTKPLMFKSVVGELLGFIRGSSNAGEFRDLQCKIWDANANEHGTDMNGKTVTNPWLNNVFRKGMDDLGRIYGVQWRNWDHTYYSNLNTPDRKILGYLERSGYVHLGDLITAGVGVYRKKCDQLKDAITTLKADPHSRRVLISAWNPGDADKMALLPCHVLQHWMCTPMTAGERITATNSEQSSILLAEQLSQDSESIDNLEKRMDELGVPKYKLNLMMYQRSADSVLGIPFNIASYATMVHIMARLTGYAVGKFYYVTGDTHIYVDHLDAVKEQLAREPYEDLVTLEISKHLVTLEDFERATPDDFNLVGYRHWPKLINPTKMAV